MVSEKELNIDLSYFNSI